MIKPKLQLDRQTHSALSTSAGMVKAKMTTNAATFPASAADVTSLGTEQAAFDVAIQDVADALVTYSEKIAARDNTRAAVEARMRKLGGQVHDIALGNVETIHAAGMLASNEPQPVSMSQVLNLMLKFSDQEGELFASWKIVVGARIYRIQISVGAPGNWVDHTTSTKSRCALNDTLVSGTKVYVRVCAVGATGEGAWSDIAWKTVP